MGNLRLIVTGLSMLMLVACQATTLDVKPSAQPIVPHRIVKPHGQQVPLTVVDRYLSLFPEAEAFNDDIFITRVVDKTLRFYDILQGNQIEYFGDDGKSYLWYPGNKGIVVGYWGVYENKLLCFVYPNTAYNPITNSRHDDWNCTALSNLFSRIKESRAGDILSLSTGFTRVLRRHENITLATGDSGEWSLEPRDVPFRLLEAADAGNNSAKFEVAKAYEFGDLGLAQNEENALKYYRSLVESASQTPSLFTFDYAALAKMAISRIENNETFLGKYPSLMNEPEKIALYTRVLDSSRYAEWLLNTLFAKCSDPSSATVDCEKLKMTTKEDVNTVAISTIDKFVGISFAVAIIDFCESPQGNLFLEKTLESAKVGDEPNYKWDDMVTISKFEQSDSGLQWRRFKTDRNHFSYMMKRLGLSY